MKDVVYLNTDPKIIIFNITLFGMLAFFFIMMSVILTHGRVDVVLSFIVIGIFSIVIFFMFYNKAMIKGDKIIIISGFYRYEHSYDIFNSLDELKGKKLQRTNGVSLPFYMSGYFQMDGKKLFIIKLNSGDLVCFNDDNGISLCMDEMSYRKILLILQRSNKRTWRQNGDE
ncbi:hypothetical protein CC014_18250 [Salmonella enterica]|nr:hypothetical protein [Salmonella enterica]EFO5648736.1 hypothetical protein [Salmonella enterica subsp. enterica serovar Miami]EAT1014601.1 hypothetical protein [Salmonella enterica]EBB2055425.1 hypothetical protein [Salmonella enterica]EBN0646553.1 hypothetical protein [Salmonella enterica]